MKKQGLNRFGRGGRRFAALLLALLMAGSVFAGAAPTALAEEAEEQALPAEETEEQALPAEETEVQELPAEEADEPVLAAAEEEPVFTESGYTTLYIDAFSRGGDYGSFSVENITPVISDYNYVSHIRTEVYTGSVDGIVNYTNAMWIDLPEETTSIDLRITPGEGHTLSEVELNNYYYEFSNVPNAEPLYLENCPGLSRDGDSWILHIEMAMGDRYIHLMFEDYREILIGDTMDIQDVLVFTDEQESWDPEIVRANGDGTVTALAYGRAFISAWNSATICCIQTRFRDVTDPAEFYYDPIYWGADAGITTGWADGTFRPLNSCNRASVMLFLYRLAGEPPVAAPTGRPFNDISAADGDFYRAVLWGVQQGITTGFDDGGFHPWATCNRAAIVTFLWRYAGSPEPSVLMQFQDMPDNNEFCQAIVWAAVNHITTGWDDGTFRPWNTCNRLAVMSFLYRYANQPG